MQVMHFSIKEGKIKIEADMKENISTCCPNDDYNRNQLIRNGI
jgi:hypothetical protein